MESVRLCLHSSSSIVLMTGVRSFESHPQHVAPSRDSYIGGDTTRGGEDLSLLSGGGGCCC